MDLPHNATIIFTNTTAIGLCAVLFSILGLLANSVLIAGILAAPRIRALVTTPFILSVSVSDLCFSVLVLPVQAARCRMSSVLSLPCVQMSTAPTSLRFLTRQWPSLESHPLCQSQPLLLYTFTAATVLSLACVTVIRATGLFLEEKEVKYRTKMLKNRLNLVVVALCWLLPLASLLPSVTGDHGKVALKTYTQSCTIVQSQYPDPGSDPKMLMFMVFLVPSFLVLLVTNTAMAVKIAIIYRSRPIKKGEYVFILMLFLVFLIWLLTTVPEMLVSSWDPCFQLSGWHAATYGVNFAKVFATPVLFICTDPGYLKSVRALLKRLHCWCGQDEVETRNSVPQRATVPSFNREDTVED